MFFLRQWTEPGDKVVGLVQGPPWWLPFVEKVGSVPADSKYLVFVGKVGLKTWLPNFVDRPVATQKAQKTVIAALMDSVAFFPDWEQAEQAYLQEVLNTHGKILRVIKVGKGWPEDWLPKRV